MEGPSLLIIKDELRPLLNKTVVSAEGSSKLDYTAIVGNRVLNIRTFGKHLLIELKGVTIKIHFLMFGSYRVNERRDRPPRLTLRTKNTEVNFYSCAISFLAGPADSIYDWSADVLSDEWSSRKAGNKLKKIPESTIGDALLDQSIFAGVGNIIRNELLFRTFVHPDSLIGSLPPKKLTVVINETRNYSLDFLRWKKDYVLKKNWKIYKKKTCPCCKGPVSLIYPGTTARRCFVCENCQIVY